MVRVAGHAVLVLALTALTQIGGLAWLVALGFRRRLAVFAGVYALGWLAAVTLAPLAGREPLPCFGGPLRMQSPAYCAMLRHFTVPEMAAVARDAAGALAARDPGTVVLALDAGFPFLDGFPLLPHLSHHDGRKLDLAFHYTDAAGRPLPGKTRSPIGYWAMETLAVRTCPRAFPTLRWDLAWMQRLWPDRPLDRDRTAALVRQVAADPRVSRILIEPPLARDLGLSGPKLRFQGCRAARHDDHLHIQL